MLDLRIVDNARRRPGSCGLDGSFAEYVAFFVGVDLGSGKRFLEGFEEWIVSRSVSRVGWNLIWPVLVMRESGVNNWNTQNWRDLEGVEEVRVVSKMFELIQAFLEEREQGIL
jgi:hypothetical protein